MSQATKQQISSARAILRLLERLEPNTKLIDCPEHEGQHKATLYSAGHRYAGIWECPVTGMSDSHDHSEFIESEDFEPLAINSEDHPSGYDIYICGECGVEIERAEVLAEGWDCE